jgi:hypothetical protein
MTKVAPLSIMALDDDKPFGRYNITDCLQGHGHTRKREYEA